MYIRFRQTLWMASMIWSAACGDDDAATADAGAADANQSDATVHDAAADTTVQLEARVRGVVDAYQEQSEVNCPCFVDMGAYESLEECEMWQGARSEWVDCATDALKDHDTPETRAMMQCYVDKMRAETACLATKACDSVERAECSETPVDCLREHLEDALMLAMSCPDLSLLPRQ
jgi:hypothetical protein